VIHLSLAGRFPVHFGLLRWAPENFPGSEDIECGQWSKYLTPEVW
jgi:hypothetical protein